MKAAPQVRPAFEVERVRRDFPLLRSRVHGRPLVYLDNAATTQKPQVVIDAVRRTYEEHTSNVHRGIHHLSEQATRLFEEVRVKAARFLNAADPREIVFVRGATEGINLVARSFAAPRLKGGGRVLLTQMEHHSNIVPWQLLREETGALLRVAPIDDRGDLLLEEFQRELAVPPKIVAVAHVSNALGTVNPVGEIVGMARAQGVPVLVDGAQAVPHLRVDVRDLGCDFYVLSGHKLFGPSGIGILWGRLEHLEKMGPYQGGGDMILSVSFEKTLYNHVPYKFEAGTPNIEGVLGLGAALDYVQGIGYEDFGPYEEALLEHGHRVLSEVQGLRLLGTPRRKVGVLSFTLDGVHPHDVGTILDREGIAIRTGHHCAQPLMDWFGVPATARASLAFYNTREEIDLLAAGLRNVSRVFHS